ncbi:hypothetical protein [Seonamhaeicola maritimus]|uniref:Uncharacterized protein n=1 Tax=Seonamhaeicola maritimus TaxID=2591822 RepID=A0A5C7GI11_9FLAO|nr:hypothetical protein [Seonamhaeicola maritimus]TXG37059.1 hypothetical protein FUA22_10870 [Seonamhaeicola maritimus]
MMKKLHLVLAVIMLSFSISANADTIKNSDLNLNNPDVRKCLLDATKSEGWNLASVYLNSDDKLVYIFDKGNDTKIYTSKEVFTK